MSSLLASSSLQSSSCKSHSCHVVVSLLSCILCYIKIFIVNLSTAENVNVGTLYLYALPILVLPHYALYITEWKTCITLVVIHFLLFFSQFFLFSTSILYAMHYSRRANIVHSVQPVLVVECV